LNVSILGNEVPQVLPISEIDFSTLPPHLPRICGYEAKWEEALRNSGIPFPLPGSPAFQTGKAGQGSCSPFLSLMDCRDYARVDIRLGTDGIPYVLEVNANPDISPDAGIAPLGRRRRISLPAINRRSLNWPSPGVSPHALRREKIP